ncbi:unnamed protein product, partial [Linum tenue]
MDPSIYDPRLYIQGGPRETDLLDEQPYHRSESVWAADPEQLDVITHRSLSRLPKWDDRIEPFIERARLLRVRKFVGMEMDNNLLT